MTCLGYSDIGGSFELQSNLYIFTSDADCFFISKLPRCFQFEADISKDFSSKIVRLNTSHIKTSKILLDLKKMTLDVLGPVLKINLKINLMSLSLKDSVK